MNGVYDYDGDRAAYSHEQSQRARKLWVAVVLAALDDAIVESRSLRNGEDYIRHWAQSRDGRMVLTNAGIDPSSRTTEGLMQFVSRGVSTATALSRE